LAAGLAILLFPLHGKGEFFCSISLYGLCEVWNLDLSSGVLSSKFRYALFPYAHS
jgi:hypothetical protein